MYDALEEIPIYVNPFLGVPENDTVLKASKSTCSWFSHR
jgi:hypothetical protein